MNHEKLLSNLVEIQSYSGREKEIREYIKNWFKERDISSFDQDENLIVYLKGHDQKKAFIFNSHMDTVVAGKDWKTIPCKPKVEGEKMIGLGVSDMKSGLTSSMLLAEKISESGKPPVDMFFTYVVKEEVDGSGTESFANWFEESSQLDKYKDLAAIFTEPNSLKEVEHGHRGNYFLLVEAKGPSGHASRPDELKDQKLAVRKMFDFADKFQDAVLKWRVEFPDKYFKPSITVGEMTSFIANARGEKALDKDGKEILIAIPGSPNKFPESCIATFDLRTTPTAHNQLYQKVLEIANESDVIVNQLYPPAGAGFTDPKERIVQIASTLGEKRVLTVSKASADLGFFTARGIKSIILGPGEKLQAHEPDEYCYPAQIPQAVELYKAIVDAWSK